MDRKRWHQSFFSPSSTAKKKFKVIICCLQEGQVEQIFWGTILLYFVWGKLRLGTLGRAKNESHFNFSFPWSTSCPSAGHVAVKNSRIKNDMIFRNYFNPIFFPWNLMLWFDLFCFSFCTIKKLPLVFESLNLILILSWKCFLPLYNAFTTRYNFISFETKKNKMKSYLIWFIKNWDKTSLKNLNHE